MSTIDSIKFRMYNTGSVGDCLLLLFQKKGVTTFKMLIDCGGWNAPSADIISCVQDIRETCKNEIDLLVVTHEHEDHLSGFNQARQEFKQITFKKVWMSWVENENDPVAAILKEFYIKKLKALKEETERSLSRVAKHAKIGSRVKGAAERVKGTKKNLERTLDAIHFELGISRAVAGEDTRTISDAINYVKNRKAPEYKNPGDVITGLKGAEGMRFYILGPPKDNDPKQSALKNKEDEDEMYHFSVSPHTLQLSAAARSLFNTGNKLKAGVSPFDDKYCLAGAERQKAWNTYTKGSDYEWRQIEEDAEGSGLALTGLVNNLVNNTSLAMAIEFEDSGNVVLLPADAQSGNWMSWHRPALQKKFKEKGGKDVNELLKNTVFYKVGHHGSHNGTASQSGLDKMTSRKLVGFMPLVQDKVPGQWGGADNFPAKALYNVLIEKTKGRLVRTDEGKVTAAKAVKLRTALTPSENREFEKSLKKGACFYEYTIKK
jgi:hypothetical protein